MKLRCRSALLLILLYIPLCYALPAFPGAEGYSSEITGGRGGTVYHVTNLASSGPGSFAAACEADGPRIIVFDTCGIIDGDVTITSGDCTIAGETAPGGGITLNGRLWTEYTDGIDNIIVRFIRIRPADLSGNQGDAIQFSLSNDFIFDHVSVCWGSDETIDFYSAKNVTLSWCTIEASATNAGHPDGSYHNYGMINGPDGGPASVHHCLWAHHNHRTPAIANGPSDIRNNVVYNATTGFVHHNPTNKAGFNFVGNYYKTGPTRDDINPFWFDDEDGEPGGYYIRDNYVDDPPDYGDVLDPWEDSYEGLNWYGGTEAESPFSAPSVTTSAPDIAYDSVLSFAGCFPRDTITRQTVREVKERSGEWGRVVPGNLFAGLSREGAPADTDGDGVPDRFEDSVGTDRGVADDDGDVDEDGYTNIEEYLHYRADVKLGRVPQSVVNRRFRFGSYGTVEKPGTVILAGLDGKVRYRGAAGAQPSLPAGVYLKFSAGGRARVHVRTVYVK